ncbi:MAG: hypothetical protein KBF37_08030 [Saprospiraceae bacterium]|jgi:hypothetical protein|nr:hypothetical protein [Saprospiraceae bacterium]MBP9210251.1 hypothetical protein [Saprospiraceae bacterium]MBV6473767.1 hypothetical protein [Saprospiraceae bacterium]
MKPASNEFRDEFRNENQTNQISHDQNWLGDFRKKLSWIKPRSESSEDQLTGEVARG